MVTRAIVSLGMNDSELFLQSEQKRVERLFSKEKHLQGFQNKNELSKWFSRKLAEQDFCCKYCETSIFTIRQLIHEGLLNPRRVRGSGLRGPVLEIDKVRNKDGYQPNNCVLACYYCNNDKSYTLDGEVYKQYFGEARKKYFQYLTAQLPGT